MSPMFKKVAAGVLLGGVLVTSACGGQSEADKRVKELSGLTHTQFVSQLDKFCATDDSAEEKARQREIQRAFMAEDYGKVADLLDEQLEEIRPHMSKLREIEPPAADSASFDRWMDTLDASISAYEPFVEALRSEDGPEFTTLMAMSEKVDQLRERSNAAIDEIGATECIEAA